MASGVLAEHQRTRRHAHGLRQNNLVGQGVLDDAILVNAGFMRERVCTHHGFIGSHLRPGNLRQQAAGLVEFVEQVAGAAHARA